jgi:FtsP/CotA-like multicopper oxidase with cupredoxin domain
MASVIRVSTSRRAFLGAVASAGALSLLPGVLHASTNAKRLVAGTRTIEVNGRAARVFRLTGPDGRPGLRLAANERFRVDLVNATGDDTIVHWHGQLPPWKQDGFPWPQTPPIAAGAMRSYDYAPIPGTYWMHSHQGLQEQNLMVAPLIVEDAAQLREDRQDVVLMLHDFSFRAPDEILASLTGMPNMAMPGMNSSSGAMHMDLNDVDYDAFLANDRTLADPEVIRVERRGRVRLRVINGASSSQFWIELGEVSGRVVAVDGHPVHPITGQRFPIAMAQRLDILIDLPTSGAFPIFAQLEGTPRRTGIILATTGARITRVTGQSESPAPPIDNSLERRLRAVEPLAPRPADLTRTFVLNGTMKPYAWSIDGQQWPNVTPLMLRKGQRVEIELVNHSMMAHPMHLHGHAFQVVALNGRRIDGAVRDTVLVPSMGSVRFAFDADNAGRWAFHCHNLYHMAAGMMTEFRYEGITV